MKKVILAALVAVASLSANAQVYLGGTLGINAGKVNKNAENVIKFQIAPEIGYNINEKWAVGLGIGFTTQNGDFTGDNQNYFETFQMPTSGKYTKSVSVFTIAPYARWTFAKTGIASFFVDGGIDVNFWNNSRGNSFFIGLTPGVKLSASEKVDFVAEIAALGFAWGSEKAYNAGVAPKSAFGFNVNNTAVKFGVYYNF